MPMLESLSRRDLVGLEHQVDALGLGEAERDLLVRLPQIRGGREVLDGAAAGGPGAAARRARRSRACARCTSC